MQNNYYFLKQLSEKLKSKIIGFKIYVCFSQNKNELILQLEKNNESFNIRINTNPEISCVTFPDHFSRSKKNNIDLFNSIVGKTVTDVIQFENDRSFGIVLGNQTLAILLYGVRANVVLFEGEDPVAFFNKKLSHTFNKKKSELNRAIDFSFQSFEDNEFDLKKHIFTLDKTIHHALQLQKYHDKSPEEKWQMVQNLLKSLEHPSYFLTVLNNKTLLSLIEIGEVKEVYKDPIDAVNAYYDWYQFTISFTQTKESLILECEKSISKTTNFLLKTTEKLEALEDNNQYEEFANILMANLNEVPSGVKTVSLFNFYNNSSIEIPLKDSLSPQKNAEAFYKKAKNKKFEIENLKSVISGKESHLENLQREIKELHKVSSIKELKIFNKWKDANEDEEEVLPFKKVQFAGFSIYVGRNAKSNDEMLQKYTHKDDLWLHAKDVTGSHVIVKYQSGKVFPANVIERAAEIAAFNSKRKTDSHCPVTYTPRKFVRKQKGLPAGAVIVEKEKVILVTPKSY